MMKLIRDSEVDLDAPNVNGTSPVIAAAAHRMVNAVKVLVDAGADLDIRENEHIGGKSALHHAVENDEYEIVKKLLDGGAMVCAVDSKKRTP